MRFNLRLPVLLCMTIVMLLCFSGCKKEETTWTVQYRVIRLSSNGQHNYSVAYTGNYGTTHTKGNIEENWWESPEFTEILTDDYLSIELDVKSGGGKFDVIILVNGSPLKRDTLSPPATKIWVGTRVEDLTPDI